MADLGYGPDNMVLTPDQSLLTRMAGGLGGSRCPGREEGRWRLGGGGGTRPGTATNLMSAADFVLWVMEDH